MGFRCFRTDILRNYANAELDSCCRTSILSTRNILIVVCVAGIVADLLFYMVCALMRDLILGTEIYDADVHT